MSQHEPVYPVGHWQVNVHEFRFGMHPPLF